MKKLTLLRLSRTLTLTLIISACGGGGGAGTSAPTLKQSSTAPPDEPASAIDDQLAQLDGLDFATFMDRSFEMLLRRYPESALEAGLKNVPAELNRIDPIWEAETLDLVTGVLNKLKDIETRTAAETDLKATYGYFLDDLIVGSAYTDFTYPASYFINSVPTRTLFFFTDIHPLASGSDASDYVVRLQSVDEKIRQLTTNIQQTASNGIIMPRILLDASIRRHQSDTTLSAQGNPYYSRFDREVRSLPLGLQQRDDLLDDAKQIIENEIIPAYTALINVLNSQQTSAPNAVGVGQFARGLDFYHYKLGHHTTSELTADEIHRLGITELERIHTEMKSVFERLGYPENDGIASNLSRAAADSGFVPAAQVVARYEEILSTASDRLSEAFNIQPQAELTVIGGARGGFYLGPSPDGSRPGAFYASNTSSEPAMLMKSLAYHEGVPGHHLQIARAMEQGQSLFQQNVTFTGFVEGWALYAERLASELGWYEGDPLGDLGRLQYEAFRAARLVVDTGIHAKGWHFEEASTFFQENTGFSRQSSDNQIARYAVWPGQATAYMVGMLEILNLRAEQQSEPMFDLRDFHDQLLTRGAVPLTMLDDEN